MNEKSAILKNNLNLPHPFILSQNENKLKLNACANLKAQTAITLI
jgi:hypothetical protein